MQQIGLIWILSWRVLWFSWAPTWILKLLADWEDLRGLLVARIFWIHIRQISNSPNVVFHQSKYAKYVYDVCVQLGGQSWIVPLGRRDARTASLSAANSQLPGPDSSLSTLISMFAAKGLSAQDMTVLSGSHSIGQARCTTFRNHIYNDANIDPTFATTRRANCPSTGGDANLAPLDIQTANQFDNNYFQNLMAKRGLLHSDQELFNNGSQDGLVRSYSQNNGLFVSDFAAAMVRMGNISPLTGTNGEIRRNCIRVNWRLIDWSFMLSSDHQ